MYTATREKTLYDCLSPLWRPSCNWHHHYLTLRWPSTFSKKPTPMDYIRNVLVTSLNATLRSLYNSTAFLENHSFIGWWYNNCIIKRVESTFVDISTRQNVVRIQLIAFILEYNRSDRYTHNRGQLCSLMRSQRNNSTKIIKAIPIKRLTMDDIFSFYLFIFQRNINNYLNFHHPGL
jgi:hypothetical protein